MRARRDDSHCRRGWLRQVALTAECRHVRRSRAPTTRERALRVPVRWPRLRSSRVQRCSRRPANRQRGRTLDLGERRRGHVRRRARRRASARAPALRTRRVRRRPRGARSGRASGRSRGTRPSRHHRVEPVDRLLPRGGVLERSRVGAAFTHAIEFRRCPKCRELNLVKESWFVCVFCDGPLPLEWNVSARRVVQK